MRHLFLILSFLAATACVCTTAADAPTLPIHNTLQERLTPQQAQRKLADIRGRIMQATDILPRNRQMLLETFDCVAATPYGRMIFTKAAPGLNFKVEPTGDSIGGYYAPFTQTICVNASLFDELAAAHQPNDVFLARMHLAQVMAHESTHSIQWCNGMLNTHDNSFAEKVVIHRMMELHTLLAQTIVMSQIEQLPEFKSFMDSRTSILMDAREAFFDEMTRAQMAMGADRKAAETFARTKFVEVFWSNQGGRPITIGKTTITPSAEMVNQWNQSYNLDAFRFFCTGEDADLFQKGHQGIQPLLAQFTRLMAVNLPPRFFLDSRAMSFKLPFRQRLISYNEGKVAMVVDALEVGYVVKKFEQGRLAALEFHVIAGEFKNGEHQETYQETGALRAAYEFANGSINGWYREFDNLGSPLLEVPVTNNVAAGNGWMRENGRRIPKHFLNGTVTR